MYPWAAGGDQGQEIAGGDQGQEMPASPASCTWVDNWVSESCSQSLVTVSVEKPSWAQGSLSGRG